MFRDSFTEEIRRARKELKRAFIAAVEDRAGHARGYISRVLSGTLKKLDVETAFAVLEHPWIDARALLERIGIDLSLSPLPYLVRIQKHSISEALVKRVVAGDESKTPVDEASLERKLKEINELQFSDLQQASERLRTLLELCPSASTSARSRILKCYAEDRRRHTRFPASAYALRGAFELAITPLDRVDCLQTMSYLASSQGWYDTAEAFAKQGVLLCLEHGLDESLGKLLFTQSVMSRAQGKVEITKHLCSRSLTYLPKSAWTYQASAYLDLAQCAFAERDYHQSKCYIEQAAAAHQTKRGTNWLKLVLFRGNTELACNRLEQAEACYQQVLDGLDPQTDPIFVAIASLFLCKAYWQQGRIKEIVSVAESMLPLLIPIAENSIASAAIVHFYDHARTGKATLALIDETIHKIEKSGRQRHVRSQDT